jgi:hypothetical protein
MFFFKEEILKFMAAVCMLRELPLFKKLQRIFEE